MERHTVFANEVWLVRESASKDDHYVSRCYLKAWELINRGSGRREKPGHIGVYARTGSFMERAIKSTAYQKGYYKPEMDNMIRDDVETPVGNALKRLRSKEKLWPEDRRKITRYLSTQMRRTPTGENRFERRLNKKADEAQDQIESLQVLSDEERQAAIELVHQARVAGKEEHALYVLADWSSVEHVISHEATWVLLCTTGSKEYVTSDNPVVWSRSSKEDDILASCLLFPLTPKVCLSVQPPRVPSGGGTIWSDIDEETIKTINSRIIANAEKEVYAKDESLRSLNAPRSVPISGVSITIDWKEWLLGSRDTACERWYDLVNLALGQQVWGQFTPSDLV